MQTTTMYFSLKRT